MRPSTERGLPPIASPVKGKQIVAGSRFIMALLHPPNVLAARTAAHPSGEFHNSLLRFYLFCLFRRYPSANVIIERLDDERGRREIPPGNKDRKRPRLNSSHYCESRM